MQKQHLIPTGSKIQDLASWFCTTARTTSWGCNKHCTYLFACNTTKDWFLYSGVLHSLFSLLFKFNVWFSVFSDRLGFCRLCNMSRDVLFWMNWMICINAEAESIWKSKLSSRILIFLNYIWNYIFNFLVLWTVIFSSFSRIKRK